MGALNRRGGIIGNFRAIFDGRGQEGVLSDVVHESFILSGLKSVFL